jgi:serine/threonine protein kinase
MFTIGSSIPDYLGNENQAVIESRVGSGGTHMVYRAVDKTPYEYAVAISENPNPLDRDTLVSIKHRNIVEHYNYFPYQANFFTYMKLLRGNMLDHYIELGHNWNPGVVDYQIISPTAEALMYLHEEAGIIHRDIKPNNIIVVENYGDYDPILFDFNISKKLGANDPFGHKSKTEGLAKTFTYQYTSKEQMQGGTTDIRTDVYAFAATALAVILKEHHVGWYSRLENDPYALSNLEKILHQRGYHFNVAGALHLALQLEKHNRTPTIRDFYTQFKDHNFRIVVPGSQKYEPPKQQAQGQDPYKTVPHPSQPKPQVQNPDPYNSIFEAFFSGETTIPIDEGIKQLYIPEICGAKVYIGYNSPDLGIAEKVADVLRSAKVKPWFRDGKLSYKDFKLGESGPPVVKSLFRDKTPYSEGLQGTVGHEQEFDTSNIFLLLLSKSGEATLLPVSNRPVSQTESIEWAIRKLKNYKHFEDFFETLFTTPKSVSPKALTPEIERRIFPLLLDQQAHSLHHEITSQIPSYRLWIREDIEKLKQKMVEEIAHQKSRNA